MPGATVTIHNEATGVDTVIVTNNAGAYTSPPLVLGQYSVTVDMQGFKKAVTSGILLQGGEAIRNDVAMQVGALQETVQVTGRQRHRRHHPRRRPHGQRRILPGAADRDRRGRAARGGRSADPARLSPHAAERRPDVPRQPVQLADQRRSDDGHRELLRRRSVRLRRRTSAEPREHAARGSRPGSEGHFDVVFGPVRPHQRRLHRVHRQVRHELSTAAACTTTLPTTSSTRPDSSRSRRAPDRRPSATTTSAPRSAVR